ncbi:hypothetical protein TW95_gp1542 [Pandoravirus inopinatum]|uniref:Uncharacterized protein n=1 Tax=Pandoravirus inopinatum TaxID=1605721 RepID=A0A0B5JBA0_9VIRU|nr:hypothetical protein TW95_gp1542 [Pandoravirus inopinatum]AJF98276.1 hypothetical protein [Pandoravirus inopinatum]
MSGPTFCCRATGAIDGRHFLSRPAAAEVENTTRPAAFCPRLFLCGKEKWDWSKKIQFATRTAVPFFVYISGLFFFRLTKKQEKDMGLCVCGPLTKDQTCCGRACALCAAHRLHGPMC